MLIEKIVSGGQTGVDSGALEAAVELGFPYGGLVPDSGQKSEFEGFEGFEVFEKCGRAVVVPDFVDEEFRKISMSVYPWKQKKIASGGKTFLVVQDLMRKLQDELMQVKVEGGIQWGVNRTEKGWFVWFINNKGMKKYACEEEIVDHAFDTVVKVTDKKSCKVYTVKVFAGSWNYLVID